MENEVFLRSSVESQFSFDAVEREYNLNDRLVKFSVVVLKISRRFPKNPEANIIADQIRRSGSAPSLHYAEAQAAESPKDFIHKMKVGLKELRETFNALRIANQMSWLPEEEFEWAIDENDQLIAIFFTSIRTAQNNNDEDTKKGKDKRNRNTDNETNEDKNQSKKQ